MKPFNMFGTRLIGGQIIKEVIRYIGGFLDIAKILNSLMQVEDSDHIFL
jgi:hypothetical protein